MYSASFIKEKFSLVLMGRIKTQLVKRVSAELIAINPGKFTSNFDKNKELLKETADIPSKKIRNLIAGSVTGLVKKND